MKAPLLVLASAMLAGPAFAAPQPQTQPHPQAGPPRTVSIVSSGTPPVIRTALLESTLIELPAEEKVATVFGGDTVDWAFDAGHVASRFISVKPKTKDSSTNLHIVSDHGNEYSLQLREVSSDPDPHFDANVFLAPGDQVARDKIAAPPVFVPASEASAREAELQSQLDAARAAQEAERKAAQDTAEKTRSAYPGELHFDYAWDRAKAARLGVQQIWRDEKFTYIAGKFEEPPVVYELKDKKGSLINFDFANGLYTIPKRLDAGYVAIGKARVDFHREPGTGE
jgi:type IV secretion system protein VirB9